MGSGVELKPVLKIGRTRINERNSKFEIRAKHPVRDQFETSTNVQITNAPNK
jgi:hypothetical protein